MSDSKQTPSPVDHPVAGAEDAFWHSLQATWSSQPNTPLPALMTAVQRRRRILRLYTAALLVAVLVGVGYGVRMALEASLWRQAAGVLLLVASVGLGSWEFWLLHTIDRTLADTSLNMVVRRQSHIDHLLHWLKWLPMALALVGLGLVGVSGWRWRADPSHFLLDVLPAWGIAALLAGVGFFLLRRLKYRLLAEQKALRAYRADVGDSAS